MKLRRFILLLVIQVTVGATIVYSQNINQEIGFKQLDSLIASKIKVEKINEVVKANSTSAGIKTRGGDPCDDDFENIGILFKNLKAAYVSCCNGNSNYAATAKIIRSIYFIINNSRCKWDDHPIMWLAIGVYWADYSSFTDKYNCCK